VDIDLRVYIIYSFSVYLTDSDDFPYIDGTINAVSNNPALFWELYEVHKHNLFIKEIQGVRKRLYSFLFYFF
jgi:hypothetical protein